MSLWDSSNDKFLVCSMYHELFAVVTPKKWMKIDRRPVNMNAIFNEYLLQTFLELRTGMRRIAANGVISAKVRGPKD